MLKIKVLKKKKKGKKGKHKEDELFNPEELEQYRREHQQKQEVGEPSDAGEGSSSEKSEEWRKFQALTAGVDDVLKKTQGDLDRIKSSSFFQRKPPGPSNAGSSDAQSRSEGNSKKWDNFQGSAPGVEEREDHKGEELQEQKEEPLALEEEEEEESEDEDIFDTSYVDVVASGDVKLAYIPDSPTEEDTGPDPFDTSIVDQVIKVDPKKKHLVSLGCAVEVLTGRVDKPIPVPEALPKKRKRPKKQDLLLGSFDEVDPSAESEPVVNEPPPKSILDEEPEFVPEEIDLSINLATVLAPPSPLVERKNSVSASSNEHTTKSVVEEFDTVHHNNQTLSPEVDDLDDEFAALAQESVHKKVDQPTGGEICDDIEDGADPFDTTFAANVLPGKFELKLIEEEILLTEHEQLKPTLHKVLQEIPSVRLNDSSNEHNFLEEDQRPLSFKHRDLLGGSTTDLSNIGDCPIEPTAQKEGSDDLKYSDPFDTSVVEELVAPGKTELKFLEKELLDGVISRIDDDADFDPRAESPPKFTRPPRPDQLPVGEKRFSIPKVVAFNIDTLQPETDLLAVDQEENSKVGKPLTPYYANSEEVNNRPSCESENNYVDPFDTSFVTHAPGKAELKLIESELKSVVETSLKRSLSDPEFDPRQDTDTKNIPIVVNTNSVNPPPRPPTHLPLKTTVQSPEKLQPDILCEETVITCKLHTPVVPKKIEDDLENIIYTDPFDTSIVNNVLPGKAELKLLESELITADAGTSIKRSYTDPDFNPRDSPQKEGQSQSEHKNFIDHTEDVSIAEKPLTPQSASSKISFELGADVDPFDTSCVENLLPGKAELKLLESELIN
ncbi:protein stoned-A [Macrosteles quadrilineatus]|uniref:protein stoned-A n=1 Tax=Macrosteles quadrilineatus TaxID=74068 RepID=UPI0023E32B36|nr:protein stoned-A [Macrosteles quadrilineatus]